MSAFKDIPTAAASGKAVLVSVNGEVVYHLTPLEADTLAHDATRFAAELATAAQTARDPRVRRDSLKPGEFFKHLKDTSYGWMAVEHDSKFALNPELANTVCFSTMKNGHILTCLGDNLIYRCKDFSGELL